MPRSQRRRLLRRRVSLDRTAVNRLAISSIPSASTTSRGSAVVSKSIFCTPSASIYPGLKRRAAGLCGSSQIGRRPWSENNNLQASCVSLIARRRAPLKFAASLRVLPQSRPSPIGIRSLFPCCCTLLDEKLWRTAGWGCGLGGVSLRPHAKSFEGRIICQYAMGRSQPNR